MQDSKLILSLWLFFIYCKGGLFFAKPMREKKYVSMMDPFQKKYGKQLTAVLAIIPVLSEVLWTAGVLATLGTTVQNSKTCSYILSLKLV